MSPGRHEAELAELLAARCATGREGIATAQRGKLKRLFCLLEGRLAFAASNLVEEQFGETLVRQGLLSPTDRASAAAEAAKEKLRLAQVLIRRGLLGEEALATAMEGHVVELLASTLDWPEGELRFDPGQPKLDGEVLSRVPLQAAIVSYARAHPPSVDLLRTRVGNPDLELVRVAERAALLEHGELDGTVRELLGRLDTVSTLGELIETGHADEEALLRAVHAMRLLGVIAPRRRSAAERPRTAAGPERPLTREEVEARLSKSEGVDHYMVLGVEPTANRMRIREAYYALARRVHPDRFRAGELSDLLARVEVFFTKVTEAYNTLHDPDRRKRYDERLAGDAKQAEEAAAAESDSSFLARQNYLRGRELVERRRLTEALKFLRNAVQLDGTKAEYALELGLLLSRNPRYRDEAERALIKVTELEPTSTKAYLALGDLYQRAERHEDAVRMYREVLRWEAENPDAVARLTELGLDPRKRGLFRG